MSSRKRRRLSPLRVVLALLAVGVVLWWISRGLGGGGVDPMIAADPVLDEMRDPAVLPVPSPPDAEPPRPAPPAAAARPRLAPPRSTPAADPRPTPRLDTLMRSAEVLRQPEQLGSDAAEPARVDPPLSRRNAPAAAASTSAATRAGLARLAAGDRLAGRRLLSGVLLSDDRPDPASAADIRAALDPVNAELVFSPGRVEGDTLTETHTVQPGDTLGALGSRFKVPYALLEFINQVDSRRLRAGQEIKLLRGPIHARVDRAHFVMDLYAIGADGAPIYLTHFPVGLGAAADDGRDADQSGTPLGRYRVGGNKVLNPSWRNPRTGAFFAADNPENPIGEYWIPLQGLSGPAADATSIGIHGTIDPDSIGRLKSMGCIRLGDDDIALLFSMLQPNASEVEVLE